MKDIKRNSILLMMSTALALSALAPSAHADSNAWKEAGVLSELVRVKGDQISLLEAGSPKSVTTTLTPGTVLGGICQDCMQFQPFKAADAAKICTMCGCGSPNSVCVAWQDLKDKSWTSFLQALPEGVGLRAVFNTPGAPASGLKDLYVNRREALLPVTGLSSFTSAQLTALVKPVGGSSAQLLNSGTLLQITLSKDWTAKSEKQFETLLTKAGAQITPVS